MDLKKRVRAELRDLLAQKKQEQEAQAILIAEVNSLREERELLLATNQTEREKHQQVLSTIKQEADFLRQQKQELSLKSEQLKQLISEQEFKATNLAEQTKELKQAQENAVEQAIEAKNNARGALDTLEIVQENLNDKRIEEHQLEVAIKFLQGKIGFLEAEREQVKQQINEAKNGLEVLIKEQARHANWDEYLQAKENFLIEQFKLLGVKYVVYNSR